MSVGVSFGVAVGVSVAYRLMSLGVLGPCLAAHVESDKHSHMSLSKLTSSF